MNLNLRLQRELAADGYNSAFAKEALDEVEDT